MPTEFCQTGIFKMCAPNFSAFTVTPNDLLIPLLLQLFTSLR